MTMEKPNLTTGKGAQNNGTETDQNEKPGEVKVKRQLGSQGARAGGTKGTQRAQSCSAERKETDGAGGRGMSWRAREGEAWRIRRGADTWSGQGRGAKHGGGRGGRGGHWGENTEEERGWRSAAEREGARRKTAEMGSRRAGISGARRGGSRDGRSNGMEDKTKQGGWRATHGHSLSFLKLKALSEKDPSEVAITLSSHPDLKNVLSETTMRSDLVELLCQALSKAFKSRVDRGTLQHLTAIIKDSVFFSAVLPYYLAGMDSGARDKARYPQQLDDILAIVSEVCTVFPASSMQKVNLVLTQLQASITSLKISGVEIQPQTEEKMETLQGLKMLLQEKSREGTLRSDKDTYALLHAGGEEDQQDFRTIPIYPTVEEFHQEVRPYLRPNFTSRRYTNTHLYLDTHFRLLREDFVRPLREGVQQLLLSQNDVGGNNTPLKKKRFDDIRVYFDTQLMVPQCTPTGMAYLVQFDIQPLKFVLWQSSKRLIYGSLVCLSCDNFESFLFATVSNRDPKDLKNGQVQISFNEESRIKLAGIQKGQLFVMVETTAYFEAYRHVLEGLQEQDEDTLPFQRYIVECKTDMHPPAYLQRKDTYDLCEVVDPKFKAKQKPCHVLKEDSWPSMEVLGLDESQMRALQLALTKELVIIQGPPGTGKTYVGLKIAQALLTNQGLWRVGRKAPLLVVCYTNHALDQFLEGIHKFLKDGIVRVGGRSSSEILKPYNLSELIHANSFKQSMPHHLRLAFKEIRDDMNLAEKSIESQTMMLECSMKGILREGSLEDYISDRHWISLHRRPKQDDFEVFGVKKPSLIMEWFGFGSIDFLQRETENANIIGAAAEAMEVREEVLIEIEEEADLIQAERFIEDTIDPRADRDGRKKAEMEEAVKKVEIQMLAMKLDEAEIQPGQSEEGWQMQRDQKKRIKNTVRKELRKSSTMTKEEEEAVLDIWTLSLPDRWKLYRLWMVRYRADLCTRVLHYEQDYQNAADRLADVKRNENLIVLRNAQVIGMTTTGAAKYRKLLQEVEPRLVIVEEAAEVLEAHTVTTLGEACQHLILIGDHQQLRPSATVYDLAKNFNLEMSMFERLVKMGLPFVRLNYQHRMKPEIARLLTPHIYSELENHPSVFDYDNIKAIGTNLFFVEHTNPEEQIQDGRSHQNKHEAMFVVALCRYLLLQEYKPEQITILTTYTAQLHCLRNLMPASEFNGVKVHVVDKYQGEENDIVLLSLVRSNVQGKVGFLNIPNRVCVALSRAKKGLYCIGNSEMLRQVKLWSNIFITLREKDQIGKALTLYCQNHPDRQVRASCAEDFQQAPEGGCTQPCEFRLNCGHVCASVCHSYDSEHKKYMCVKKCQKTLCDQGHKCPLVCHKECPEKCRVKIEKIIPQCQHTQMVPCYQDPMTFICQVPCQKLLHCGHACESLCGEPCSKCMVKVTLELRCGHSQQDSCFYKTQTEEPVCKTPCEEQLKCGHACRGTCGKCNQGRFHFSCFHQCDRLLVCSHKCREPCTRACPPCERPCENRCIHSQCMNLCGQACAPCIEPCTWQCVHQSCSKLCHEPCDRPPCTQPCAKILDCGHPCIGLCGDKCPNECRICNHDKVTEILFGTEDDPDAYFIQLEDCGHIIEHKAMDTWMDDNQKANEGEKVAIKLKECPKCRTPIRKNLRYGSHINGSLAEIEMVKMKINGNQAEIEKHRKTLESQWEEKLVTCDMFQHKEYMRINDQLTKSHLTANNLWILENKMDFLVKIARLRKIQGENVLRHQSYTLEAFKQFVCWVDGYFQKFTDQQVFDLQRELQRLTLLTEINTRCDHAERKGESAKIQSEVQTIREVLEKYGPLTEQDHDKVKEAMMELDNKLPASGLRITEEEKKMIVSAMKMQPGHWFKCPNGHVYVITECGGAMESRTCPDCEATIGGASHRLESGNQVASEMDGSQHAAWSETNNLDNYWPLD